MEHELEVTQMDPRGTGFGRAFIIFAEIAPLIPPARRGGRKRTVNIGEVCNRLLYGLSTGCQWRALPKDLPPRSTVFDSFGLWQADGT